MVSMKLVGLGAGALDKQQMSRTGRALPEGLAAGPAFWLARSRTPQGSRCRREQHPTRPARSVNIFTPDPAPPDALRLIAFGCIHSGRTSGPSETAETGTMQGGKIAPHEGSLFFCAQMSPPRLGGKTRWLQDILGGPPRALSRRPSATRAGRRKVTPRRSAPALGVP